MEPTQFLKFAECFPEPMLLAAQNGEILAENKAARAFLGLPDTGAGSILTSYVKGASAELTDYLQICAGSEYPVVGSFTCISTGQWTLCHGRAINRDRSDTAILLRCTPSVSSEDDFGSLSLRFETLQREIARRHQVETELRIAKAHAQAVLDTAVDGIITIDQHGVIQSFNQAAERMFGYASGEVIGQNVKLLMPQPYRDEHDVYIQHYLATGEKKIIGVGREVNGLRKNRSTFPMELAVSEVQSGKNRHFTGIVRDISERKRTEERLRQQEQEALQNRERLAHFNRLSTLGEMATGIAHEINQPLTAISFYARTAHELLAAMTPNSTKLLEILDKIGAQAQRAGDIIQRLRHFARKREGKRELCELNQLVQDTLILLETDARQRHFSIETTLTKIPLPIVVDPIQIQQVILNLIRNAVEAMMGTVESSESIVVAVATHLDGSTMAQVAVSDKGMGITDALAAKLFDPFFTTKPLGTGLGLSISRTIITSHGGRLWFKGNEAGGTTMYFTLPLADNCY